MAPVVPNPVTDGHRPSSRARRSAATTASRSGSTSSTDGVLTRRRCREPIVTDGVPSTGASRTPADELPTTTSACCMRARKYSNRIDGRRTNRGRRSRSSSTRISWQPGSLLGSITTKSPPSASAASTTAAACSWFSSGSVVTGCHTSTP